jgi:hypothetical protein
MALANTANVELTAGSFIKDSAVDWVRRTKGCDHIWILGTGILVLFAIRAQWIQS